jgi:outer membrane receptor protein involved in Fe transport
VPWALASDETLNEIVITAALQPTPEADLPQSVSVLDADTLRAAGVQHFEDVLGEIPDLNWAAGTSRPRFFQLRGIGEVEQYQGAPNPSVGFLIDDIDFSGVGMPATLFDTQQIEVLRGPIPATAWSCTARPRAPTTARELSDS